MAQLYYDGQSLAEKAKLPTTGVTPEGKAKGHAVGHNGETLSADYIPVLGAPVVATAAAVTSNYALPSGVRSGDVVRVVSDGPFFMAWGDGTKEAAATDNLFLAGDRFMKVPSSVTHFAVLRAGGSDAKVYVSKTE